MTRSRSLALAIVGVLVLAPLSACAASNNLTEAPSIGISEPLPDSAIAPVPVPGLEDASAEGAEAAPGSQVDPAERSIVRSGDLALRVTDVAAASEQVAEIARELQGTVESEYLSPDGANLAIRVPEQELESAFTRLSELGEVDSQNRSAVDVTTEHVDLTARVAVLKASVARLGTLLVEASSTSDLIEVETALSARQQELDGLTAQLEALEGQIEEATIWVTLTPQRVLPGGGPATFWDGIITGFQSIGAAAAGGIVVLGVLLPWLLLGGVIAGAVVWIVRATRRRRRAARLASVADDPGAPGNPSSPGNPGNPGTATASHTTAAPAAASPDPSAQP